ncbi:acyl-CoA dehydrogenase family protein [Pseudonocardia sp. NPDC046786]|uniref:acyl-CoA dehydrogenase family protein n=1 Tax=Pseudonocardia sp. NPDC046786 TaxID=3155471 RepID=UPI0033F0939D
MRCTGSSSPTRPATRCGRPLSAASTKRAVAPSTSTGFAAHREWERTLFEAGWTGLSWPREYGGDVLHEAIFAEAYERAGGPVRITRPALRFLGPG